MDNTNHAAPMDRQWGLPVEYPHHTATGEIPATRKARPVAHGGRGWFFSWEEDSPPQASRRRPRGDGGVLRQLATRRRTACRAGRGLADPHRQC